MILGKNRFYSIITFFWFFLCVCFLFGAKFVLAECYFDSCYTSSSCVPGYCDPRSCYYTGLACSGTVDVEQYQLVVGYIPEWDCCMIYEYVGCGGCSGAVDSKKELWVRVWDTSKNLPWGRLCSGTSFCDASNCWGQNLRVRIGFDPTGVNNLDYGDGNFSWSGGGFAYLGRSSGPELFRQVECVGATHFPDSPITVEMADIDPVKILYPTDYLNRRAAMSADWTYSGTHYVTLTPPGGYVCTSIKSRSPWGNFDESSLAACDCTIQVPGSGGGQFVTFNIAPDTGQCALPTGALEVPSCAGGAVSGWACDATDYTKALTVVAKLDGVSIGTTVANSLGYSTVTSACGGQAYHRFSISIPSSYWDGNTHSVTGFATDYGTGGGSYPLSNNPQTFGPCLVATPTPFYDAHVRNTAGSAASRTLCPARFDVGPTNISLGTCDTRTDWLAPAISADGRTYRGIRLGTLPAGETVKGVTPAPVGYRIDASGYTYYGWSSWLTGERDVTFVVGNDMPTLNFLLARGGGQGGGTIGILGSGNCVYPGDQIRFEAQFADDSTPNSGMRYTAGGNPRFWAGTDQLSSNGWEYFSGAVTTYSGGSNNYWYYNWTVPVGISTAAPLYFYHYLSCDEGALCRSDWQSTGLPRVCLPVVTPPTSVTVGGTTTSPRHVCEFANRTAVFGATYTDSLGGGALDSVGIGFTDNASHTLYITYTKSTNSISITGTEAAGVTAVYSSTIVGNNLNVIWTISFPTAVDTGNYNVLTRATDGGVDTGWRGPSGGPLVFRVWNCRVRAWGTVYDLRGRDPASCPADLVTALSEAVGVNFSGMGGLASLEFNTAVTGTYNNQYLYWSLNSLSQSYLASLDNGWFLTEYVKVGSPGTCQAGLTYSFTTNGAAPALVDPYAADPNVRVDFAVSPADPWFQLGGSVRSGGSLSDPIPETCALNPSCDAAVVKDTSNGVVAVEGLINKGCSDCRFGSPNNWRLSGAGLNYNTAAFGYDYFAGLVGTTETGLTGNTRYFKFSGDQTMSDLVSDISESDGILETGKRYVLLVDGSLEIDREFQVQNGGLLLISLSGDASFLDGVNRFDGVLVADGSIAVQGTDHGCTGSSTTYQLKVNGSLVADADWDGTGTVSITRDLAACNSFVPVLKVLYRADFWWLLPARLSPNTSSWEKIFQ